MEEQQQQPVVQSTEPALAPTAPVTPAPVPSGQTDSAAPTVASDYLTRAELDAAMAALKAEQEQTRRALQSERDRQKDIQRRLKDVGQLLKNPDIAAYLGEDADAVQRKLQADIMAEAYTTAPEPAEPEPPSAPAEEQELRRAFELVTAQGLTQTDPEWGQLDPRSYVGGVTSPAYQQAVQYAKIVKQQRLSAARPVAPPAPPPPSTPPPAAPTPPATTPEPVAMAMGGGGASGGLDPITLAWREFEAARQAGNTEAMAAANEKIQRSGK